MVWSAESLRQRVLEFCRVGSSLSSDEMQSCGALVETLKCHFRREAENLVRRSADRPVLISYTSDATSYLCSAVKRANVLGPTIVRRGRALREFLMQRLEAHSVSATGQHEIAIVPGEPLSLAAGKRTGNLFSAGCTFFGLARQLGHRSISVFHLTTDRATLTSLDRAFRQRQKAFYQRGIGASLSV